LCYANNLGYILYTSIISIALFDPIADHLASGSGLVSDPAQLAAASHLVSGVAADSATQVLVRVMGLSVGDNVQLVLSDEDGPTGDVTGAGYLSALPSNGATTGTSGGTLNVTAVDAGDGTGTAFAVYAAPTDFVRTSDPGDTQSKLRSVSIQATDETTGTTTTESVSIVRPPVAFVHGIWGATEDFSGADGGVWQVLQNQGLFIMFSAAYNIPVAVSSTTPSYSVSPSTVRGNNLGFKFGATTVLPEFENIVTAYKPTALIVAGAPNGGAIAAVQVDVVAHSMGGDVTRALPEISGYADQMTYDQGYVHKLITLDTPHQGSPLAPQFLLPANACLRNALGLLDNRYSLVSVTSNAETLSGAVGDMQPESAAIDSMQAATGPPIPTAMVGGQMSPAQLSGAGKSFKAGVLKALCPGNPLELDLNAASWPSVLGGASDAIVPLASQFDGQTAYSTSANTFQAVHSPGAEALGFGAPTILDQASGAPAEVFRLLNTPVSSAAIFEEKP
jgi:hypothetical protein